MATILHKAISDLFSGLKMFKFRIEFNQNVFPSVMLKIGELGTDQASIYYPKQW